MYEAEYYEKYKEGVRCTLCPHNCTISEGNTGFCGVRKNEDGILYSTTYGYLSSVALDDIEKKPLNLFHPGSKILSIGSFGCNLSCGFCQNYMISKEYNFDVDTLEYIFPENIIEAAIALKKEKNIGLAYTYNEPFINYEYVKNCSKLIKANNLQNVLVTNGFINEEPLKDLLPYIDAANIDLKSFRNDFYAKVNGKLANVKKTIEIMNQMCHVEVTTLIIPGENDSISEIEDLVIWLASVNRKIPLHISKFFPKYKYGNIKETSREKISELCEVASKYLLHVYPGNV